MSDLTKRISDKLDQHSDRWWFPFAIFLVMAPIGILGNVLIPLIYALVVLPLAIIGSLVGLIFKPRATSAPPPVSPSIASSPPDKP